MRISDWSSDVCSSDLRTLFLHYDEIAGDPVSALAKVLHHLGDGNPIADPAAVARVMGSYSKAGAAEPFCPRGRHRRPPLEDNLANIVTETAGNDWRACLRSERRRGGKEWGHKW